MNLNFGWRTFTKDRKEAGARPSALECEFVALRNVNLRNRGGARPMKSGKKASNIPGEDMRMESRSRTSVVKAGPGKSGEKAKERDRRNFLHTSLVAAVKFTLGLSAAK